jgi:hypothetical protein
LRYIRSAEIGVYYGEEPGDGDVLSTKGEGLGASLKVGRPDGNFDLTYALSRTERMLAAPRITETGHTVGITYNHDPNRGLFGMPLAIDVLGNVTDYREEFPEGVDPFRDPSDETDWSILFRLRVGLGTPANESLAASHRDGLNPNLR